MPEGDVATALFNPIDGRAGTPEFCGCQQFIKITKMSQPSKSDIDLHVVQLYQYVQDVKQFRLSSDSVRARARTQMIFNVIGKLRQSKEERIEELIRRALGEVDLDFDISSHYENICWKCYRGEGCRSFLDSRVDSKCPHCNWLICPKCGSCRDVHHGGCESQRDNPSITHE